MNHYQEYININQRKGFPRSYWFNQFIRWFTVIFALLAIIYAGWLIFTKINTDSTTFTKVVPFLILFFALNSLLRNLFSLNRIIFKKDKIEFQYILRKSVVIFWQDISSIKLANSRQKILNIKYKKSDTDQNAIQELTLAFPKMLEILNSILEMTPQAELDDFMKSVAIDENEN